MRSPTVVLLVSAAVVRAAVQQCSGTAKNEGGNWWCGAVKHILYSNVGHPGTYKDVTHMGDDGSCGFTDVSFSGPLAPLNEELTPVFRGPMNLKQFAVYNLAPNAKRAVEVAKSSHARRHGHQHFHQRAAKVAKEKREVWVTATIDGQVVSWINDYFGPTPAAAPPVPEAPVAAPVPAPTPAAAPSAGQGDDHLKAPVPGSKNTIPQQASQGGAYTRVGYYNADQKIADGIVFLGNYGGQGSGKFDYKWGNSLSYLNSQGTGGAASPQILDPVYIPSNKEFTIFSDKPCQNDDCGYYRPGAVAYHGFGGSADKVFLFEFNMPLDGSSGFNADMSALWLLNAKIPRTAQYSSCSCWATGCGEFDILEVLAPGDTKCKSTFHTNVPGGSSDYFDRPVDKFIKVATVLDADSGSVSVKILPDDTDFSTGLSLEQVKSWVQADPNTDKAGLFSLFTLAS